MILEKKVAVITGSTGVIGNTIAHAFAREGCALMLFGRSQNALLNLQKELKESYSVLVEVCTGDVIQIKDVQALMTTVEKKFGQLDILVTVAGVYGEIGTVEQCDPIKWLNAVHTNLFGTFLSVKYALPLLQQSGCGKIIAFAGGGEGSLPHFTAYASSKGAILRFIESVSEELASNNIEINTISPGLVNSGLVKDLLKAGPEKVGQEKYQAAMDQSAGVAETVSPGKAAALAIFLASQQSDGLTGKNISAVWDNWQDIPKHIKEIKESDIFNWRRIKPKDRGYDW